MFNRVTPQSDAGRASGEPACPTNVVFITPRFHPCPGGYENYIAWLAKSLFRTGANVTVFTTNALDLESFWLSGRRSLPAGQEIWDGINIHRFEICHRRWLRRAGRLLSLAPSWQLRARFGRPGFRVIGMRAALAEAAIDVIHVGPLPYNHLMYYGIREAQPRGIRVICTPCTHFGEDDSREVAQHYTRPCQLSLLNHCDAVLALTNSERERLIQLGVSPEKISTTGAGIDPEAVTGGGVRACRNELSLGDAPVVLHLGMKAFDKGSVTIVEAMKLLWAQGSRAVLVMAGPSLQAFDDYLAQQPVPQHLVNMSVVTEEQKRNLLATAAVVVQPSRVESFGLVYLEAWANDKPIIAADTAVSRDLIDDGADGLLVPFGDKQSLATAIDRLLQSHEAGTRMGAAGRQKVCTRYSWDSAAARILPHFGAGFQRTTTSKAHAEE